MIRRYLWIILLLVAVPCYALNPFQAFMMSAGAGGAAASCTWQTAWSVTDNTDSDDGAERNYRQVIPASTSSYNGTKVRITYKATSGNAWTIDGASVGESTADDDFDAAPTRIKFSGANSGTASAGNTLVSDEITFSFDKTKRYIIHTWTQARHMRYDASSTGLTLYYTATSGDGTDTQSVSYSSSTAWSSLGPIKVEVCSTD